MTKLASIVSVAVVSSVGATTYNGMIVYNPKDQTYAKVAKLFKDDGGTEMTAAGLVKQFSGKLGAGTAGGEVGLSAVVGTADGPSDKLTKLRCIDFPSATDTTDEWAGKTTSNWTAGKADKAKLAQTFLAQTLTLIGSADNTKVMKFNTDEKMKTAITDLCDGGVPAFLQCTGKLAVSSTVVTTSTPGEKSDFSPVKDALTVASGYKTPISGSTCAAVIGAFPDILNNANMGDKFGSDTASASPGTDGKARISLRYHGSSDYKDAYKLVSDKFTFLADDQPGAGSSNTTNCCEDDTGSIKTGCWVAIIGGAVAGAAAIGAAVWWFACGGNAASESEAAPATEDSAPTDQADATDESAAPDGSSGSGLKTGIIVVVVLVLVAGLAFFFCSGSSDAEAGEEEEEGDATEEEG